MNSNGFISAGNEPGVHACDAKGMDIRQMPLTFACAAHLLVYNKIPDLCIPFFLHFHASFLLTKKSAGLPGGHKLYAQTRFLRRRNPL